MIFPPDCSNAYIFSIWANSLFAMALALFIVFNKDNRR